MRKQGTERVLDERGEVFGRFAPAEAAEETDGDQGVLRWDPEGGARLELINPREAWPDGVGGPWFTAHGVTTNGQPLSLFNAWVKRRSLGDAELTIHASTLVLDQLTRPDARWERMIMRTQHLHAWLPETGLVWKRDYTKRMRLRKMSVSWTPPPEHRIPVPGGEISLGPAVEASPQGLPNATLETSISASLQPRRPQTVVELNRRFAYPLLALVVLAADRPDTVTREVVRRSDPRDRAVILRRGQPEPSREWERRGRFLFRADDLPDLARSVRAWYRLWRRAAPAIETYVGAINDGTSYSPARLVAVVTALEAYHRAQLGRGGSLERKLKDLRDYGDIDPELSFCTNRALQLVVASRVWYSHLEEKVPGIDRRQIEEQLVVTTRRAAARLQGCLMRNLGIPKRDRNRLFKAHYSSWPLVER